MEYSLTTSLVLFSSYIIGAIPTAAIIGWLKGIDITRRGSGNSGATNVARVLGIPYFFPVFFIDSFKAFMLLFVLQHCGIVLWQQVCAAIVLLCGNGYSWFLQWRGGKGISTAVGILFALIPGILVVLIPLWFFIFYLIRTVGVASVAAVMALPITAYFYTYSPELIFLCLFIAGWCLMKHSSNIKRFLGYDGAL
jgi:glycerol-3-phosphate acyltransferase PlsY